MTVLLINIALALLVSPVLAYALALNQIFFAFVKEGTAMAVVRGGKFSHFLMAYHNHYFHDPRRSWYDPNKEDWEVLPFSDEEKRSKVYRGAYSRWAIHLRLLEKLGIYYYGFWPFFQIEGRKFQWAERHIINGHEEPWHREGMTQIFYVSTFSYWLTLVEAEDINNIPIDLDYLLTVEINNPYKARYTVADWLARLTADANNSGKVWVASRTFENVVRERKEPESASEFVGALISLNKNLPTEQETVGAPEIIGVRIKSAALQKVSIAGRDQAAIATATTAKVLAERNAQAAIAAAEGEARVVEIGAAAEKKRIETVFGAITQNPAGVRLAEVEAIKAAGKSPGSTIIWAQNPGLAALGAIVGRQNPPPTITQQPEE